MRRGERHAVHVVRELRLGDLRRDRGVRERIPEAQPCERHRLAERAEHDEARVVGEQRDGRRPAEVLIRFVHHHEGLRLGKQALHRPVRERGPRGVVGRIHHDRPRAGVPRGSHQRIHVEAEVGSERHRDMAPPVHRGEQAVQAEGGHGGDDRRGGADGDGERRLDQLVGAVADEHPLGHPAVPRGEALQQLRRRERRIAVPRGGAHGVEHRVLERVGSVERALVLIQLPRRRGRGERVRRLRADLGFDQGERCFSRGRGGTHTGNGKGETGNVRGGSTRVSRVPCPVSRATSACDRAQLPTAPRERARGTASSGSRQRRARTRAPRCLHHPSP